MTGIANAIVGLWFLPVTLFILIPLTMLVGWLMFQLLHKLSAKKVDKAYETTSEAREVYVKA